MPHISLYVTMEQNVVWQKSCKCQIWVFYCGWIFNIWFMYKWFIAKLVKLTKNLKEKPFESVISVPSLVRNSTLHSTCQISANLLFQWIKTKTCNYRLDHWPWLAFPLCNQTSVSQKLNRLCCLSKGSRTYTCQCKAF